MMENHHNYDLLTKHREQLVSGLKPAEEKLDSIQRALKYFDTRAKELNDQRAAIEVDIHKEIEEQHQLLDERTTELVGELNILTQQKLKNLVAQTQVKLVICLEYAEECLKGTDSGEVCEHISTIQPEPEINATMELVTKGKEPLQAACRDFLEIEQGGSFSFENSLMTGDGLKTAVTGEIKVVSFQAMTKNNEKFKGTLDLKAELVHIETKKKLRCEVVKQQNGKHEINYHPMKRGKHELHITVNGDAVRGSPFLISVTLGKLAKPSRVIYGLDGPRGTVFNNKGQLIVIEGHITQTVSVFTPEGEKIQTFGQLNGAFGVTVDKDDNIYVVESTNPNYRINKFSSNGELVAAVDSTTCTESICLFGICYNRIESNLYVLSFPTIQVLSTELKFIRCFGISDNGNESFNSAAYGTKSFNSAAFDSANNLYVTKRNRVLVFNAERQFLRAFSQKHDSQDQDRDLFAIAIDSSDTVYVSNNCVVILFTSEGDYITTFGVGGWEIWWEIYGLSIDCNDAVVVSDCSNGRLQKF